MMIRQTSSMPGTTPNTRSPSPDMTRTMETSMIVIVVTPARNLPFMMESRNMGWETNLLIVPVLISRLMESKPSTNPMRGPKKATNCARENPVPVEVKSIKNTNFGLAIPSSSSLRLTPVM